MKALKVGRAGALIPLFRILKGHTYVSHGGLKVDGMQLDCYLRFSEGPYARAA